MVSPCSVVLNACDICTSKLNCASIQAVIQFFMQSKCSRHLFCSECERLFVVPAHRVHDGEVAAGGDDVGLHAQVGLQQVADRLVMPSLDGGNHRLCHPPQLQLSTPSVQCS